MNTERTAVRNLPAPRARLAKPETVHGGPLDRTRIGGSLSLLAYQSIAISAVPRLIVRVQRGTLCIAQHGDPRYYMVRAGEQFITSHAGPLFASTITPSQLAIEWPRSAPERLSPGLEPMYFGAQDVSTSLARDFSGTESVDAAS